MGWAGGAETTQPQQPGPWGVRAGRGAWGRELWLEHHLCPKQLLDLKLTVDGLEKERDFYFSKLRDIELICQEHESENSPVISGIISILYATEVSSAFTHSCPGPTPGPPGPDWKEPWRAWTHEGVS